jgi:alanine dehydrogenase
MDRRLDASVAAVSSSAAAVEGADVVITATNSPKPVFDGDLLEPGTHVTAMGQYHPEKRELDDTAIARSTYVVDLRGRLDQDAGAYMHAVDSGAVDADHCHAELGEVVAGAVDGRTDPDEITVFDSGGTGIETAAAAALVYEKARDEGLGQSIEFAPASDALTGRE